MQTHRQTFNEVTTDTCISFVLGVAGNWAILPVVAGYSTLTQSVVLTVFFIVLSFVRRYAVRRWFNKRHGA